MLKQIWGWIVGGVVIIGVGLYFVLSGGSSNSSPATTTTETGGDGNATNTGGPMVMASGTNMGGMKMSMYKDGTYTGPVSDAIYGKLQVVATISGGMITNVTWPVYPNDPGHTTEVNTAALPQLKQEVITAQNANVNVISGATQTSEAFQESLAAALAQAKS